MDWWKMNKSGEVRRSTLAHEFKILSWRNTKEDVQSEIVIPKHLMTLSTPHRHPLREFITN